MKKTAKQITSGTNRRNRQRDRILALLRSTSTHPTASWIYDQLKVQFPRLSFGTVYRNLGILVNERLVNRIDFGSTFDRFDAKTEPHYHFICEQCERIIDLEVPVDAALEHLVDASSGRKVHRHEIEFYGICESCSISP